MYVKRNCVKRNCIKRNCVTASEKLPDRVIDTVCYDYANKLALAKKQMQRLIEREKDLMQRMNRENKRRDVAFEKAYRNYLRR